jgi:integrase
MSVRWRPERGAWFVDVVVAHADGMKERIRARSPVNTKRAALDYERQLIEAALSRGSSPQPTERRMDEFAVDFLETYASANNKPSEVAAKKRIVKRHIVPALGHLLLSEITTYEIERFKAALLETRPARSAAAPERTLSRKTVRNILAVLGRMLRVATDWGFLATMPQIQQVKVSMPRFDFLTFEEAGRLLDRAEPDWYVIILSALRTGMRLGELCALRWEDVDLVARCIVVRHAIWQGHVGTPKSGKEREIPIADDLLKALNGHHHLRGELVFYAPDGSALRHNVMQHALWRAARRAGLRRIGWHTLRHSFASHLTMRGVPLRVIQELMGHATVQMTMRYSHLAPGMKVDAVNLLARRSATAEMAPAWHQNQGATRN